jgi:glycosyltransferase involved in cell wall biosynthesis
MKLSVIIPCFNEKNSIKEVIARVQAASYPVYEIIVVDDFSTDGSRDMLGSLPQSPRCQINVLLHSANRGKGAAIRTGLAHVNGDAVLIQDADLEYDPAEYDALLKPIIDGKADVVYGSRFVGGSPHRVVYFWHRVANGILTLLSNMFTNLNLTDMETGFKVFKREFITKVRIREDRFGFEPEITAKMSRLGARFYEVGITYHGRTYSEGKKIGMKDAFRALFCIIRYSLTPH